MEHLSNIDILVRMAIACGAGGILGYERESHGRAAGMRTTMLVCVASCLAMIISELFYLTIPATGNGWRPDPARLAAGVLTGIGFLGAGTIMRQGLVTRGVTTAAILWFVTVLGLAFGAGFYVPGLLGFAIALASLYVLPHVEGGIASDWYASVEVVAAFDGASNEALKQAIEAQGVLVKKVELDYDRALGQRTMRCFLKFKRAEKTDDVSVLAEKISDMLFAQAGVTKVKWK